MKQENQNVKPSIVLSTKPSKNKLIMKTINLTLTGFTISEVLKTLHDNELTPTYLGTDQNFNLLFKVSYYKDKEEVIKNTLKYMGDYAQLEQEFDLIIEKAFSQVKQTSELEAFVKRPFKNMAFSCLNKIVKKTEDGRG